MLAVMQRVARVCQRQLILVRAGDDPAYTSCDSYSYQRTNSCRGGSCMIGMS